MSSLLAVCFTAMPREGYGQLWLNSPNFPDIYSEPLNARVGIGVDKPFGKLDIRGTGLQRVILRSSDDQASMHFWANGNANGGFIIGNGTNNDFFFYNNNLGFLGTPFVIKNSGFIGINEANPLYRLHVNGEGLITGRIRGNESIQVGLFNPGEGATGPTSAAFCSGSTASGNNSFAANGATSSGEYSAAFNTSSASGDYSFSFGESSSAIGDWSMALGLSNSALVTNSIALGSGVVNDISNTLMIGINNPPLASNNYKPLASLIVTKPLVGDFAGFVGIGTSTPTSRLHVNGGFRLVNGSQASGRVLTSDAAGNATWQPSPASGWALNGNAITAGQFLGTTNGEALSIRTNGIERMQINSVDGNIGVNTNPVTGTKLKLSSVNENYTVHSVHDNSNQPQDAAIFGECIGQEGIGGKFIAIQRGIYAKSNQIGGEILVQTTTASSPTGLIVNNDGVNLSTVGPTENTGIFVNANSKAKTNYGIRTYIGSENDLVSTNYGITSVLEETKGVNNYAVYGNIVQPNISTTQSYYAIYGNTPNNAEPNVWAGYFNGRGYFAGKVGVGDLAPNDAISVKGDGIMRISVNSNNNQAGIALTSNNTGTNIIYSPSGSEDLRFFNGSDRVTFTANGRVGIGTTAPGSLLSVAGGVSIGNGYKSATTTPSNGLIVEGRVGIGKINPVSSFQIGDVQVGTSSVNLTTTSVRLDVLGGIRADIYGRVSDARIKSEVKLIDNSIEIVKALRGVSYVQKSLGDEIRDNDSFKSLGFIAQEVQKVLPELALLASDGYYAVDYDGIIPVLVEAIKEQQKAIEVLQEKNSQKQGNDQRRSDQMEYTKPLSKNKLEQNIPNPFSGSTTIRYSFIEGIRASLMIFDLNGTTVHKVEYLETGDHELVLELSKLASGMYYYSLVVDGAESVTKRMVLNK